MDGRWRSVATGVAAGLIGSTGQAALGKTLEKLILPHHEDADIAPRMMKAIGKRIGKKPSPTEKWAAGTLFHYAYGAGWGAGYALVRERLMMLDPLFGGSVMGGIIYGITFPRWGLATLTGTERPPHRRTARMEAVALSVAVGFGLIAACSYEALRSHPVNE